MCYKGLLVAMHHTSPAKSASWAGEEFCDHLRGAEWSAVTKSHLHKNLMNALP